MKASRMRMNRALLLLCLLEAVHASVNPGDYKSLTDIAPLLALFGERLSQQFMAESYTWFDYILFAMAPLGIITAFISAIRVAGPEWLKSFVGRSKENFASAEMELLSSVSQEVCELWNGRAIVRVSGQAPVMIVHVPRDENDFSPESFVTLDPATQTSKYRLREVDWKGTPINHTRSEEYQWDLQENLESKPLIAPLKLPPNVSINSHDGSKVWELMLCALAATGLQIGVLIATWKISKLYQRPLLAAPFPRIGFIMIAVGTCTLTCSLIVCAWIVDNRTKERYFAPESTNRNVNLCWVQTKKPGASTSFESYLLFSKNREMIKASNRRDFQEPDIASETTNDETNDAPKHKQGLLLTRLWKGLLGWGRSQEEVITIAAVFFGILGFGAQFQGVRLSSFFCGLAQVIAMLIATVLRAFVRRKLTKQPMDVQVHEGHELDHLALCISGRDYEEEGERFPDASRSAPKLRFAFGLSNASFISAVPSGDTSSDTQPEDAKGKDTTNDENPAQRALNLRIQFGAITELKHSPKFDEAIALAKSIEAVLNILQPDFSSLGEKIQFELAILTSPDKQIRESTQLSAFETAVADQRGDVPESEIRTASEQKAPHVGETVHEETLDSGAKPAAEKPEVVYETTAAVKEQGSEKHEAPDAKTAPLKGATPRTSYPISITLVQQPTANGGKEWKADTAELEAILSLADYTRYLDETYWKKRIREGKIKDSKGPKVRDWPRKSDAGQALHDRVFLTPPGGMEVLMADLLWWGRELRGRFKPTKEEAERGGSTPPQPPQKDDKDMKDTEKPPLSAAAASKWGLGLYSFRYAEHGGTVEFEALQDCKESQFLAMHIFSAFIWAIGDHVCLTDPHMPIECTSLSIKDNPNCRFRFSADGKSYGSDWTTTLHDIPRLPQLRSSKLDSLVEEVQTAGLGTPEEILLAIIPPLSSLKVLPNDAYVDWWYGLNPKTNFVSDSFSLDCFRHERLFQCAMDGNRFDRYTLRVAAYIAEFLFQAAERPIVRRLDPKDDDDGMKHRLDNIWGWISRGALYPSFRAIQSNLRLQGRGKESKKLEDTLVNMPAESPEDRKYVKSLGFTFKDGKDFMGWTETGYRVSKDMFLGYYDPELDLPDVGGATVLHHLATKISQRRSALWDDRRKFTDVGKCTTQRQDGRTVLHCAVARGNTNAVTCLLEDGAELNASDYTGRTPFGLAVLNGDLRMIQHLIERSEKRNKEISFAHTDIWKHNALHYAAWIGHERLTSLLIDKRVPINHQDITDRTPLDYAVEKNHLMVVEILIKQPDIDEMNCQSWVRWKKCSSVIADRIRNLLVAKGVPLEAVD